MNVDWPCIFPYAIYHLPPSYPVSWFSDLFLRSGRHCPSTARVEDGNGQLPLETIDREYEDHLVCPPFSFTRGYVLRGRARGNMLLKIEGGSNTSTNTNTNPTQTLIFALQARGSKMTKDEDFYLAFLDKGVSRSRSRSIG
jgi:hypothetical protein